MQEVSRMSQQADWMRFLCHRLSACTLVFQINGYHRQRWQTTSEETRRQSAAGDTETLEPRGCSSCDTRKSREEVSQHGSCHLSPREFFFFLTSCCLGAKGSLYLNRKHQDGKNYLKIFIRSLFFILESGTAASHNYLSKVATDF